MLCWDRLWLERASASSPGGWPPPHAADASNASFLHELSISPRVEPFHWGLNSKVVVALSSALTLHCAVGGHLILPVKRSCPPHKRGSRRGQHQKEGAIDYFTAPRFLCGRSTPEWHSRVNRCVHTGPRDPQGTAFVCWCACPNMGCTSIRISVQGRKLMWLKLCLVQIFFYSTKV